MRRQLTATIPLALTGCTSDDGLLTWLFALLAFTHVTVFVFATVKPRTDNPVAMARFNRGVWCIAALAVIAICTYFWLTTGQSSDSPWWPYLAALASLLIAGAILLVALAWRFFRFRRNRNDLNTEGPPEWRGP